LWIIACHFLLFLLAIVLSVLLRFTDYDYPLVSSNPSLINEMQQFCQTFSFFNNLLRHIYHITK